MLQIVKIWLKKGKKLVKKEHKSKVLDRLNYLKESIMSGRDVIGIVKVSSGVLGFNNIAKV